MEHHVIEETYPIAFRKSDASKLGTHLKNRHSVVLIGMKRVGISNFLRFFLHHKDIVKSYIRDGKEHLFIPVDLNDLVEREIFPFWRLTFKRILDAVFDTESSEEFKKDIEHLFLDSIQSQDLFLTIDGIRKTVDRIITQGIVPTIFFIRFDRIKDAVTPEFFSNLQGLQDASYHKLSYVFTSFRGLNHLSPDVFSKASLSVFSQNQYIQPAKKEDILIVYKTIKQKYNLQILPQTEKELLRLVDGYIQYLQLALIFMHERKSFVKDEKELFDEFSKDERICLQSEELWESLTAEEQEVLVKIASQKKVSAEDKQTAAYIFDTGMAADRRIFSPLFESYIKPKEGKNNSEQAADFTKKELLLFQFLQANKNEVCEREKIIEYVWPEEEALGVSDWAIDRLVARVRNKLKSQKSEFEIQTVKTRGYKLVSS